MENGHRNSAFSHRQWWLSIAMLNYQRVHFRYVGMTFLITSMSEMLVIWNHNTIQVNIASGERTVRYGKWTICISHLNAIQLCNPFLFLYLPTLHEGSGHELRILCWFRSLEAEGCRLNHWWYPKQLQTELHIYIYNLEYTYISLSENRVPHGTPSFHKIPLPLFE